MNILICLSHNYIMPYGIMLESLFTNNEGEDIHVYAIIDDDVTEDDKKTLDDIVHKYHAAILYEKFVIDVCNLFPDMKNDRLNRTIYFRLFSASLLPKEVTKILYLDGDIIIMDSLRSLWETNLNGIAVAGVMDQYQNYNWYNRLHYPSKFGYINNGVLLINLKYWRMYQVEKRFMTFIQNHPERIKLYDQDVLNYVLREEKCQLSLRYNVQNAYYYKPEYSMLDYWSMEKEILDAQNNPIILHFAGGIKPWHIECEHPKAKYFDYYKSRTIWADLPLLKSDQTWRRKILNMGRWIFELLHILPRRIHVNKYVAEGHK